MSMFGAVDLSSLASATKPTGPTSGTNLTIGDRLTGAAGSSLSTPLIADVDAPNLCDIAEVSTQVPVIVVLYSPRSQTSADLTTILEQLTDQYAGRFQVARINVDMTPEIAQVLQVQTVPTVVVLIAGQPVPIFQGAVSQEQPYFVIDQLLEVVTANDANGTIAVDGAAGVDTTETEPEEAEVERAARKVVKAGDSAAAKGVCIHVIAQNPGDGDLRVTHNQARLVVRLDGQNPHELLTATDVAPTDLAAALAGADAALTLGDVNTALGCALEAVRIHMGKGREEAQLQLLELFGVIGSTSPEVAQARRRLATMLC